jgi:nitronate monooxygenase
MKTNRIAELLSIRYPIFQAPMGRTAPPRLAAAVTNAGGLGMLGTSWDAPDVLREKIRATRALTGGPFAVNLAMPWDQHERLEISLEEGVKAVSLFWGDPAPYMRTAKDVGMCGPLSARWCWCPWFAMPYPGCRSSRRAAWRMCAAYVLHWHSVPKVCGSARDSWPPPNQARMTTTRNACWQRCSTDTVYTTLFDQGWPDAPHRALRNSTVDIWESAGRPATGKRPREGELVGAFPNGDPIRRYGVPAPMQGATGEIEAFALYAGQSVGLIRDLPPVASVMEELARAFA